MSKLTEVNKSDLYKNNAFLTAGKIIKAISKKSDSSSSTFNNSTSINPSSNLSVNTDLVGGFGNMITGNVDFQRQLALNQYQNAFNAEQAQLTRDYNLAENQKQRDWYQHMSDTSYTRAVEDMRNAGLNPYLAYTSGGATTAYGSSASVTAPTATSSPSPQSSSSTAGFINAVGNLISTAIKVLAK